MSGSLQMCSRRLDGDRVRAILFVLFCWEIQPIQLQGTLTDAASFTREGHVKQADVADPSMRRCIQMFSESWRKLLLLKVV